MRKGIVIGINLLVELFGYEKMDSYVYNETTEK